MKQFNLMKKAAFAIAAFVAISFSANAQLSGSYTVGGSSPDYSTLSAAISALNSSGVSGPVEFLIRDGNYSGNSWRGSIGNVAGASSTNTITIRSQSANPNNVTLSNSSSNNYIFRFANCKYVTVKDLTLVKTNTSYGRVFDIQSTASNNTVDNCVLQANKTTSSSNARALVYALNHTGTDNTFKNCEFINGGTWAYLDGSSTSSSSTNWAFENNTFSGSGSNYYGFYMYYTRSSRFANNEFTRTGSGYFYLMYSYYENNDFEFIDNTVDVQTSGSYLYGLYMYYCNYSNGSTTQTPVISDNDMAFTNTTSYTRPLYNYYMYYADVLDNTIDCQVTSGRIQFYGPIYQGRECHVEGNTINMSSSSSGYGYTQYFNYNSSNNDNLVTKNTFNFNCRYNYNYICYYGKTKVLENTYNLTTTTGGNYTYIYYANGLEFAHNKIVARANSGTTYGAYEYGSTSYQGAYVHHNDFDLESNTGTVYGAYPQYTKTNWQNNVVTTKTSGTSYLLYNRYTYDSHFKNNTFHSYSTGSTNYGAYIYNTSSSYKTELKNNIFTKSSSNGYLAWFYNKSYVDADYNLYNEPSGGTQFYCRTPSYSGNSLQDFREKTEGDMNSLVYQVPYTDLNGRDLSIDASAPAAWAVNGRAIHDTTIKTDFAGTNRPYLVPTGVPDLGAYEVTPTSTPPYADAVPAAPVANSSQVFTFGQDTVATIDWGATVPSTYNVRQYTGIQAAPMPTGVGRMYFYVAGTPSSWIHTYTANVNYKDPWLGDIPAESDAVIARSSNGGAWEGYNFSNAATDVNRNILKAANPFDSVGSFTGVQNGRIGIRCVQDPTGIVISNITAFEADVDWNPVFNPIGYQVVFKKLYEAPTQAEWDNSAFPTSNSLAANGLDEDTKYYVYVRSVCGVKDTSGFSVDSFTTIITCHEPTVGISNLSDTRAVIYWNEIKTAEKYEYALTTSQNPPAYGTDLNKMSVLATFLDPNTQYYAHVRAHCNTIYEQSNWVTEPFKTWPLSVGSISADNNGLAVYPNPVANEMIVTIGGVLNGAADITIMDMTGKVIKTTAATGNKVTLNVSELPSGMYILRYTDSNSSKQVKFNKQ